MKQPIYIEGKGWRYPTEHRMTRWPDWKDSRLPGTYMFTLNINGGQRLLGHLEGTTSAIYEWMRQHPADVGIASNDALYYRHALLGTRAMPFVLKENDCTTAVKTALNKPAATPAAPTVATPAVTPLATPAAPTVATPAATPLSTPAAPTVSTPMAASATPTVTPTVAATPGSEGPGLVQRRFYDVAPPTHRHTHFPVEALALPDAPHIVLSALGEQVLAAWQRMPQVVPQIEHVCLAIMPNHLHAIVAVHSRLSRPIGAVIRSFMGTTSHALHQLMAAGQVQWDASTATLARQATPDKPNLWSEGFCVGVCQTEQKLHTRIGYVLENPFFGILEQEQNDLMQRVLHLTIAGRAYGGYGNMFLLKEPDRIQVFCHRTHPVTHEPYHLTQDFLDEKADILQAVSNGAVIVTPGISPGEADIMWSVLKAGGSVINVQKEEIPINSKWHPEKERRLYCSQGQMLVLAVHDLPNQVFYDRCGQVIPTDTKYARFHLLYFVAAELCAETEELSSTVAFSTTLHKI